MIKIQSGQLTLSIADLPAMPMLIAGALRAIEDPGSSSVEIEAVVMRDQALAARVLRIVNSAAYGFGRRIETIREAVVLLGVRKMKTIAAAMVTAKLFAEPISDLVEPRDLWAHSLTASLWAMEIISAKNLWQAQSAVTAALLHDIGIVMLCRFATDPYKAVLQMSREEGIHHVVVEQRELGTTHAHVGAMLCAKWCLPVSLTHLVGYHHTEQCPADSALSAVVLANHLAHLSGAKPFNWSPHPALPEGLLESLDLDGPSLVNLMQQSENVQDRAAAMLSAANE